MYEMVRFISAYMIIVTFISVYEIVKFISAFMYVNYIYLIP
jgi:hypothetical protein